MFTMRPAPGECGAYFVRYVACIGDGEWQARLDAQPADYRALLAGVDDDTAALPLAPGKWSLLDVMGHVADTERVFAFRLLWFARGDGAPLPGFDQDAWASQTAGHPRTLAGLLDDFEAVRPSTRTLLRGLPDEVAARRGVASDTPLSVRALAWLIPGHAEHHLRLLANSGNGQPATGNR